MGPFAVRPPVSNPRQQLQGPLTLGSHRRMPGTLCVHDGTAPQTVTDLQGVNLGLDPTPSLPAPCFNRHPTPLNGGHCACGVMLW